MAEEPKGAEPKPAEPKTPEAAPRTGEKRFRVKKGGAITFLLLLTLFLLAFYVFHVQRKKSYLVSRNFRVLSSMGTQIRQTVNSQGRILETLSDSKEDVRLIEDATEAKKKYETAKEAYENHDACEDRKADCLESRAKTRSAREAAWKEHLKAHREMKFVLGFLSPLFREIKTQKIETRREEVVDPSSNEQSLQATPSGGHNLEFLRRDTKRGLVLTGKVDLEQLLKPLLRSRGVFDTVLLADAGGKVIYQERVAGLHITDLATLAREISKTEKAKSKDEKTPADQQLFGFGRTVDLELSGRYYTLFVEPLLLPIRSKEPAEVATQQGGGAAQKGKESKQTIWYLCGLVPRGAFFYATMAVSSNLLALIVGSLLLAILSWPFVKLKLIGEKQRIRLVDVVLVGVCSLMGASLCTIGLRDLYAYQKLLKTSESQVSQLARQMEKNFAEEIRLAYGRLVRFEEEVKSDGRAETWSSAKPGGYLFGASFALADQTGWQRRKASTAALVPPRLSVEERPYFERARREDTWRIPELDGDFALEPVIAWSTGERVAVLAKPVQQEQAEEGSDEVAMMAIPMVSLIRPVLPPGFEFAVVDYEGRDRELGQVLFHSDPGRNLSENFFEEVDQDRRLRSIVFARQTESVGNLRYWGKDYLAAVNPIDGLPWTIVALRSKQVLRSISVEWLVTALLFVLFYIAVLTVFFVTVALLRPDYRADWIWPDPERGLEYVGLCGGYAFLLVAFAALTQILERSDLLVLASGILPLLILVLTYLYLSPNPQVEQGPRDERGAPEGQGAPDGKDGAQGQKRDYRGRIIASLIALVLLGILWMALANTPAWWVSGVAAVCTVLAASKPWWGQQVKRRLPQADPENRTIAISYPFAGALLLILMSVLPAWGFFEAAHQTQFASFLKHGQLKLAMDLKARHLRILREVGRDMKLGRGVDAEARQAGSRFLATRLQIPPQDLSGQTLDVYAEPFFGTKFQSNPPGCSGPCTKPDVRVSGLFEAMLPRTTEYSVETRELLHSGSSDGNWFWHRDDEDDKGEKVVLHSQDYAAGRGLVLSSHYDLAARAVTLPELSGLEVFMFVLYVLLFLLLGWMVFFISRRIFLLDLAEALWVGPTGKLSSMVGSNVFLIGRQEDWKEVCDEGAYSAVVLVNDLTVPETAAKIRRKIASSEHANVLLKGFDESVFEGTTNGVLLRFLEELVEKYQRTVVVLSTVDPTSLFFRDRPGDEASPPMSAREERWKNLLASFTLIHQDLSKAAEGEDKLPEWLKKECRNDRYLLKVGRELSRVPKARSREQILEEFGERAESRYRAIWASCSADEALVLEQIAEEGFVNEKNRRLVRRLMIRGLVHRRPNLLLMNETFRRFVIAAARKSGVLALEEEAEPSSWDKVRLPFSAVLTASLVFFFATQQSLLEGIAGTLTGLTAGLPALIQIFNLFGGGKLSGGRSAGQG